MTVLVATTQAEVTEAVARFLRWEGEARSDMPVVTFEYADGTGGAVRWVAATTFPDSDIAHPPYFIYFLRTDTRYAEVGFTPESFHKMGPDIVALVHLQAQRAIAFAAA